MSDPPTPMTPAILLAVAARLGFVVKVRDPSGNTANDLGVLADGTTERYLVVASGGVDGTWILLDALPPGFGAVLVYRSTYDILREGTLSADGTIAHRGRSYRAQSFFTGTCWAAKALAVEIAA